MTVRCHKPNDRNLFGVQKWHRVGRTTEGWRMKCGRRKAADKAVGLGRARAGGPCTMLRSLDSHGQLEASKGLKPGSDIRFALGSVVHGGLERQD